MDSADPAEAAYYGSLATQEVTPPAPVYEDYVPVGGSAPVGTYDPGYYDAYSPTYTQEEVAPAYGPPTPETDAYGNQWTNGYGYDPLTGNTFDPNVGQWQNPAGEIWTGVGAEFVDPTVYYGASPFEAQATPEAQAQQNLFATPEGVTSYMEGYGDYLASNQAFLDPFVAKAQALQQQIDESPGLRGFQVGTDEYGQPAIMPQSLKEEGLRAAAQLGGYVAPIFKDIPALRPVENAAAAAARFLAQSRYSPIGPDTAESVARFITPTSPLELALTALPAAYTVGKALRGGLPLGEALGRGALTGIETLLPTPNLNAPLDAGRALPSLSEYAARNAVSPTTNVGEAFNLFRQSGVVEGDVFIRWDKPGLFPGEKLPPSRVWEDGEPIDQLLHGTAAIDPRAGGFSRGDLAASYEGTPYLVRGLRVGLGEDPGEVILREAEVIRSLVSAPPTPRFPLLTEVPAYSPEGAAVRAGEAPGFGLKTAQPIGGGGPTVLQEITEAEGIAQKLVNAVRTAEKLTPEQLALQAVERSKRVGALAGMQAQATTLEAANRAAGALKGELPKLTFIPPDLATEEWDKLAQAVTGAALPPFAKLNATNALDLLRQGAIPEPSQLAQLARVFPDLAWEAAKQGGLTPKLWDQIVGILGLPQAFQTFLDASATLRQAIETGVGNPQEFWKAVRREFEVITAAPGEAGRITKQLNDLMMANSWMSGTEKAGFLFEEVGGHLQVRNALAEAGEKAGGFTSLNQSFFSRLAQMVPGMTRSQDAMNTVLNHLRTGVYAKEAQRLWDQGIRDIGQYEALARVINHGTGYGSWRAPDIIKGINAFFSPRYLSSRVELFSDPFVEFAKGNTAAGKLASKNLVSFVGTNVAILELLNQTGVIDVDWNPLHGDFGKAKIGNLRIDPWAGTASLARFVVRAGALTANSVGLETGYTYRGKSDIGLLIQDFLGGKLGPIPAILSQQLGLTEPFPGTAPLLSLKRLMQTFTPFIIQDTLNAFQDSGWKGAILAGSASFLGLGAQAYQSSTDVKAKILAGIPESYRTDSSGKVQGNWWDLTSAQQNQIERDFPEQAAQLKASSGPPTPSAIYSQKVADQRSTAFSAFQQSADGHTYRATMSEIASQARAVYEQLNPVERKETAPDRILIQDFFNELDKAGSDFDERDRLEAAFRANLNPQQNAVLDAALMTSSDPHYQELKEARAYINTNYWDPRDAAYTDIWSSAGAAGLIKQYGSYTELAKAAFDKTNPNFKQAAAVKTRIDQELSIDLAKARLADPYMDALLYVYGYKTDVWSLEAQRQAIQMAREMGLNMAKPPLKAY